MTAQKLDGKATAAAIKSELTGRVAALRDRGFVPGLATVLVGDDPASRSYVRMKHADCAEVGISSIQVELPATASTAQVTEAIEALNADPAAIVVAPGTSCRHQIADSANRRALHPLEVLADALE